MTFDEFWQMANDGRYGKAMAKRSWDASRVAALAEAEKVARDAAEVRDNYDDRWMAAQEIRDAIARLRRETP